MNFKVVFEIKTFLSKMLDDFIGEYLVILFVYGKSIKRILHYSIFNWNFQLN